MKCSYCHKKEAIYMMPIYSQIGFCSKVCIANHTIKLYNIKKIKESKENNK